MSSGKYSYETGVIKTFHTADYAVFACTLAVSAAIGLYYVIKDRKRQTTDEYLLAGKRMHPVPVPVSSFISTNTILGTPSEVYVNNTMYIWISLAGFFMSLGAAHIYIPVFYKLGVVSVFQYAEIRFGYATRVVSCVLYIVLMLCYIALVLYAPSLALNAVTGLSLWGSIIAVSLVCIFYTCLGGMKAVLWADTLQMTIVFAGMATLLVLGANNLGGLNEAWNIAKDNGRIVLFDFDLDPRVRHSVWNVVIGGGLFWMAIFGTNQAQVQRALSVRSVGVARLAIWLNFPGIAIIVTLCVLVGVVMHAFYAKCDPLKLGVISKPDQLLPLYMMDLLGDIHGLPGLMLSCVFSGGLSTISSGLNALSAVLLEDFVRPLCCRRISARHATLLSRLFVVMFGLLSLALAFVVAQLGAMILQMAYIVFGVIAGPLLGMFTLGMLFPWANKKGGFFGLLLGFLLLVWIGVGTKLTKTSVTVKPPVSIEGCNLNLSSVVFSVDPGLDYSTLPPLESSTLPPLESSTSIYDKYTGIQRLYTISYMWYTAIGMSSVILFGMIISLLTGRTKPSSLDPKLICPVFDVFCPFLPEKIRKPLRFGVRHDKMHGVPDEDIEKSIKEMSSEQVIIVN